MGQVRVKGRPLGPMSCKQTQAAVLLGIICLLPAGLGMMEAINASRTAAAQNTATSTSGKRRLEDRCAFDKRLRFSVRQTESAYRYRDIVVKKQDSFTHILLSTKSSENNTLNPEVSFVVLAAASCAPTRISCHGY